MINKNNEKKYTNTLTLNMFELVRFIKFWIEYDDCCGNEDIIIYNTIEWEVKSILDMVWTIPLKWYLNNNEYEYLEKSFNWEIKENNEDLSKYINIEKDIKKYEKSLVFIWNKLFYLKSILDNSKLEVETLNKVQIIESKVFIPLKWKIEIEDYNKLNYWWSRNSVIKERILERWDFILSKKEDKDKIIFNITSNKLKFDDIEDICWTLIWELEMLKNKNEKYTNKKTTVVFNVQYEKWLDKKSLIDIMLTNKELETINIE